MGIQWHWGYSILFFSLRIMIGILMHLLSAYTDYIDKNLTTTKECAIYFYFYSLNAHLTF